MRVFDIVRLADHDEGRCGHSVRRFTEDSAGNRSARNRGHARGEIKACSALELDRGDGDDAVGINQEIGDSPDGTIERSAEIDGAELRPGALGD